MSAELLPIKFAFKPLLINRSYCWEPCQ